MINSSDIQIKKAYLAYNQSILFDQLNMTISSGKVTSLLGRSGVGKTTLLKMLAGLIHPEKSTQFRAEISPHNVSDSISYMAQTDLLLPWLTAIDNTLIGFQLRGSHKTHIREQALTLFDRTGLTNCENKYPRELSGGMRQRVALIRTLLENKPIVLMDEPFASLDAITRFELQDLALEVLKNKTVLLITHDPLEALRMSDEIFILSGQPATISTSLKLATTKPRNLADEDVISNQEKLFEALRHMR